MIEWFRLDFLNFEWKSLKGDGSLANRNRPWFKKKQKISSEDQCAFRYDVEYIMQWENC